MKLLHTITKKDVGKLVIKKHCEHCGSIITIPIVGVMGRVLPRDVGKRIYKTKSGIVQVENDEQMKKRVGLSR